MSKLRTMKRKMDREAAIPTRRVQIMEELWQGVVSIAKEQRGNPTMIINRILAEAIGSYQQRKQQAVEDRDRLVKLPGEGAAGMKAPVQSALAKKIAEGVR